MIFTPTLHKKKKKNNDLLTLRHEYYRQHMYQLMRFHPHNSAPIKKEISRTTHNLFVVRKHQGEKTANKSQIRRLLRYNNESN